MGKYMRRITALILGLNLVVLTGCNALTPIVRFEQRIMVQLVGIDLEKTDSGEELYKISIQFSMGKSSDGGKTENDLKAVAGSGANLFLATQEAQASVGKDFFFTHTQVIVLGEEIIKQNAMKAIEEYVLYCDYHSTANIAGVYGKAEELLSMTFKDEYTERNKVSLVLENAKNTGVYPVYQIYETFMSDYSTSGSVFIPMLRTSPPESAPEGGGGGGESAPEGGGGGESAPESGGGGEGGGGGAGSESSGGGGGAGSESSGEIFPDGGVLLTNRKLIAILEKEQCLGLSLVMPHMKIASNIEFTGDNEMYSLKIFKIKSKITPIFDGENLSYNVKLSAVADKADNHFLSNEVKISEGSDNDTFIKLAEEQLESKINDVMNCVTDFGGDIFALEDSLKHYDYFAWIRLEDNWYEALKATDFNVDVSIKII